jgi:formylglycine-generating enzyme required for sulfatase activity
MISHSSALQPGTLVGELQINAILGVGTFGITYLATDPAIGTRFALKEYFPSKHVSRGKNGFLETDDEKSAQAFADGMKAFLNEARMLAALDHPNIVSVLRYFEANGTAYFLMPFYQGAPLHRQLESKGVLDREAAKALLIPLMDALEYLHSEGVVHQDVKPANIYMTDAGQPVLLDFGVAAADQQQSSKLGSAGYAAPEQASTDGSIGPWTDIYGLAATLYRSLTGGIPPSATERLKALAASGRDPLPSLKEQLSITEFGGLIDAIELGMQLQRQDRPRDVAHWRQSFESLDWHRTVVVPGSSRSYAKEGREWLPITLLAILVVSMMAIGVFLLTDESPETSPPASTQTDTGVSGTVRTSPVTQTVSAEETERWQAALQADTVSGYRRFIEDYPESFYKTQAETQLDILDEKLWQELSPEDTVPAYEDYLDVFPNGIHQAEALQRMDAIRQELARQEREKLERERQDDLAFENASNERTIPAFDRYISDWPSGRHIEEATRVRRLLSDQAEDNKAFQLAQKLNTKDAFQAYIDAFPTGVNITAALQHIDDLTLRPGKAFRDCEICPALMVIPAGSYWQGSDDSSELALGMEKPRRMVTIDRPFAAGIHEVTMAQWDACIDAGGCSTRPTDNGWGRGDRPVIMVSWNDAEEYVRWLSDTTKEVYRLPSESEWEYIARAGEESDWPGGQPDLVCNYGNIAGAETGFRWQHTQCADTASLGTSKVGSFRANAFGLYDTTGNVSEWTADCMNLSYLDAPVDGSAWGRGICSSHMTRGGSWITGSNEIRLPARFNLKNGDQNDFTGFRVVRDIKE